MKLNAKQLREINPVDIQDHAKNMQRRPMYFILENIYDTYNIGGLFRLADALAISKMYICGETEIPPNHKIVKASVGTYKVVPWEYKKTAAEAIEELRKQQENTKIFAVEQSEKSIPYQNANYTGPVGLVLGNETYGVLPETMEMAYQTVEIAMWGINKSLNVIVSAAIVSYFIATKE
ncbi:hypothetical protein BH09PAT2_BH09PAT2_02800 [soil metagenome]